MTSRDAGSHVLDDGRAKISYEDRAKAVEVANMKWAIDGQPRNVYLCAQKPPHYHVGHGISNLTSREQGETG